MCCCACGWCHPRVRSWGLTMAAYCRNTRTQMLLFWDFHHTQIFTVWIHFVGFFPHARHAADVCCWDASIFDVIYAFCGTPTKTHSLFLPPWIWVAFCIRQACFVGFFFYMHFLVLVEVFFFGEQPGCFKTVTFLTRSGQDASRQ